MKSEELAAWISDGLGLVAIVVALGTALYEQRRSHRSASEAAKASQKQAWDRRVTFLDTVLTVIDQAAVEVKSAIDNLKEENGFTGASATMDRLKLQLTPLIDVIWSLRQAVPFDADIAISLSRVFREMDRANSPPANLEVRFLRQGLEGNFLELEKERGKLEREKAEPPPPGDRQL